jgi:glycosyltransferase involved in cell wall biosynthesis
VKKGISVVICTYNGKNRLVETLIHLIKQNANIDWEIVFVDNASVDNTLGFIIQWWAENGNKDIPIMFLSQPRPGKQYAQELGYDKANYEYLLVCDDDNWLCDTYVQTAFEVMESDDQIGALGGWCDAVFETDKPHWFDLFASNYAIVKQMVSSGDITNSRGVLYGAGMVIRKSHWLNLEKRGFNPLLTCRKGDTLSSGGDTEYSFVLRLIGFKMWFDERLYFKHYMTEGRLNLTYLRKLRKGMSTANVELKCYVDELNARPLSRYFYLKKIMDTIFKYFWKNLFRFFSPNLGKKEKSKSYFRELRIMIFSYNSWLTNRRIIRAWLQSDPKDSL